MEDEDQINHFMSLYGKADSNQSGRISKEQLIDAIRDDLKLQLEDVSIDSPQIQKEEDKDPITAFKLELSEKTPTDESIFKPAKLDLDRPFNLEETGEFIGFGQIDSPEVVINRKSSLREDPILKQLKLFNSKNLQGIVRCDNLRHALEYISKNKLDQYGTDPDSLCYLFELLIENSNLMSQQF